MPWILDKTDQKFIQQELHGYLDRNKPLSVQMPLRGMSPVCFGNLRQASKLKNDADGDFFGPCGIGEHSVVEAATVA